MDGLKLDSPDRRQRDPTRRRGKLGLRVLVVEDDEQVATVLSALLEAEGYEVSVSTTAEAGLGRLAEEKPFHLLISDYWLPDRTGAWMLGEASRKGLLNGCKVLVITAEHRPQGVENLAVLRKPLDLDDFLRHVQDVLAPIREEALQRAKEEVENVNDGVDGSTPRIELTLYISASSPTSLKALRNLQRLLRDYQPTQLRLTICDLSREHPATADEDRIAFTPTLVKRSPGPKVWVLGDLEDSEIVGDLLAHSGLERVR